MGRRIRWGPLRWSGALTPHCASDSICQLFLSPQVGSISMMLLWGFLILHLAVSFWLIEDTFSQMQIHGLHKLIIHHEG